MLALLGSGAFIRFLAAGAWVSLLAWLAGALFVPSLALVLGVLSGSGKPFEVIYVLWMYGVLQRVPAFDFVGTTPQSPWFFYAPLALSLTAAAFLIRQVQMRSR